MKVLLIIALFLLGSFIVWDISTRKYINPYKLHFFIGKKGSGKSTVLTKIALQSMKKGKTVFSTEPIPGTYVLNPEDIGFYEFPPGSVILIDEVSLVWPNRDWKKLKNEVVEWFRLQRHRKLTVYLFSQTFDADIKIRDQSDSLWLVSKKARVFSMARRIEKNITIRQGTAEAPSTLAEDYQFVPLLQANAFKLTYIPKWSKYFDSFVTPALNTKEFVLRDGSLLSSGQSWGKIILDIIKPEVFDEDEPEDDDVKVYEPVEVSPALLRFLNEDEKEEL